jgi:hypothetical protein
MVNGALCLVLCVCAWCLVLCVWLLNWVRKIPPTKSVDTLHTQPTQRQDQELNPTDEVGGLFIPSLILDQAEPRR